MAARILVVERNPKIGGLIAGQLREKGSEASSEPFAGLLPAEGEATPHRGRYRVEGRRPCDDSDRAWSAPTG